MGGLWCGLILFRLTWIPSLERNTQTGAHSLEEEHRLD